MLKEYEIDEINRSADSIVEVLKRFPHVDGAGKTFTISKTEQPELLRFICEGKQGGYILEFEMDLLKDYINHVDLLSSLLHVQVLERKICPSTDWKSYHFSSSDGLEETYIEIPKLQHQVAS